MLCRFAVFGPIFLAVAPLAGQNPRPPEQVPDFGGQPTGAAYARGVGDGHAVAAHTYPAQPGVMVAFQESPGGSWSAPSLRVVDSQSVGLCPTVMVIDEIVFVCWVERTGNGATATSTLYYDLAEESGSSWRGPAPMAGDPNPGGPAVADYTAALSAAPGGGSSLRVLVKLDVPNGVHDELLLYSSSGGGGFGPPLPVPDRPPQAAAVGAMALAGGVGVHVIWTDTRFAAGGQADVFYRSLAAGGSAFGPEQRLSAASAALGEFLRLDARASGVAAAWLAASGPGREELLATLSANDGASFTAATRIGAYDPLRDDVDAPSLALDATGTTATLVWNDDRSGVDQVYASIGATGSGQWMPDAPVFAASAATATVTASTRAGGPGLVSAVGPSGYQGAFSLAPGAAWTDAFALAPPALAFEALASAAYDPLYDDFVLSWLAVENGQAHQYAGGIRPQTLAVVGSLSAGAPARFALRYFPAQQAGDSFQVLASGARGHLLLADGRDLGLRNDSWLDASRSRPELRGRLSADGSGQTTPLTVPLPPGTAVFLAALSIDQGVVGSITDVLPATVVP